MAEFIAGFLSEEEIVALQKQRCQIPPKTQQLPSENTFKL